MFSPSYHDATKHHFHRFAQSLGYLDWDTQPDPFRRFDGARLHELPHRAVAADVAYDAIVDHAAPARAMDEAGIGEFLRCSMAVTAWKRAASARWALRANPSSGNLHPTETYIVRNGGVYHYAPREHALEARAELTADAWASMAGAQPALLVGLTSVIWREAWKYGERAFRYCQHDVGHAIGALRYAAALLGWRLALLPRWSDDDIGALLGVDREEDFAGAEREEPECVAVVTPDDPQSWLAIDPAPLVAAARLARWQGRANRLSSSHVEWPIIDRVAAATRYPGGRAADGFASQPSPGAAASATDDGPRARHVMLTRRSAVAFDARSDLPRARFLAMLARLDPARPPFDAIDWPPHVHLAIFVHRVSGLTPGLYACVRDAVTADEWRRAMRPEFLWERVAGEDGTPSDVFLLAPIDVKWPAMRVSCDQDIAGDGFFSLAMIARFEQPLRERGDWFYRRLFWECGLIGQALYLEAEAAGARATGIGCFYDDAVHEVFGLKDGAWQSLYHFSMGVPVDDARLTTEPAYPWEAAGVSR